VVDTLLPWYVNGTLEGEELECVLQHLEGCTICRQEVQWLRELHAACAAAEATPGASKGFRNLRRRLEARSPDDPSPVFAGQHSRNVWVRWAVAASLAVIAVISVSVLRDTNAPALYRTLGASSAERVSGSIIVLFDPATTEAELRRILRVAEARVVDGPTAANAYVLDVPASRQNDALRALRKEHAVVLAEPLGLEKGP